MKEDLVISARNVTRNKEFGDEPGESSFLLVPTDQLPKIEHKVPAHRWMAAVIGDESVFPKDEEKRSTGDLLVFVHGYNNDQNIVMERHRRLRKDLQERGFKGAVVSFDWPSANSALNYLEDRSDAKQTALQLVTDCILPFSRYQQANCRINVHILAHSTGAFVLREAFDDADDRPHIAAVNWTVSQVLFIGADISSSSMSAANPTTSSLRRHCVRLTNYWNPYDSVLKLSNAKRVGLAPRVGRVGLPQDAPPHFVDVDCGEYWQETQKKRNAKSVIGDLGHSWHIGDPVFTQDLLYTLQGDIDRNAIPTRSSVADNDLKLKAA